MTPFIVQAAIFGTGLPDVWLAQASEGFCDDLPFVQFCDVMQDCAHKVAPEAEQRILQHDCDLKDVAVCYGITQMSDGTSKYYGVFVFWNTKADIFSNEGATFFFKEVDPKSTPEWALPSKKRNR